MQSVFPFEKNRYFPYKRMRSGDFSRELHYMDLKFQLLNRWVLGTGPAFGLDVQRMDTQSLLISPGIAVDQLGRYLIVEEPVVCRLSSLAGFDTLRKDRALLWLSYREELRDPLPVQAEQGTQTEYAVIAERYAFSLRDWDFPQEDAVDQALCSSAVICGNETLRVRQIIPRVLSARRAVTLQLVLDNFGPDPVDAQIHYAPQLPGFHTGSKTGPLCLDRQVHLPSGSTTVELAAIPDTAARSVTFSLPEGGFTLQIHGSVLEAPGGFQEEVQIVPDDPLPALAARLSSLSLEELTGEEDAPGIPIAGLRFFKCENSALLDGIIPLQFLHRSHFPAIEQRLSCCGALFSQEPPPVATPPREAEPPSGQSRHMTTGVTILTPGVHEADGQILRSPEIAHELGPGTVYVDFGVESVYPLPQQERNGTDLLLGDASLFVQPAGGYDQALDRGVRIHPDKGTFELALRPRGHLRQRTVRLRWFAWRPETCIAPPKNDGKLLRLEPTVAYAKPGGVLRFSPVFSQDPLPCTFFVPERQAGTVGQDGVYTAPHKDGLYQVCVQVQGRPETKTSAFVIVRAETGGGA